jgi:hypothetical protein
MPNTSAEDDPARFWKVSAHEELFRLRKSEVIGNPYALQSCPAVPTGAGSPRHIAAPCLRLAPDHRRRGRARRSDHRRIEDQR